MTLNEINVIRARLGSIPPAKLNGLPKSVQKLLEDDLPALLAAAVPRHDLQASLGAIAMAVSVLRSLPVADEQNPWLGVIKQNINKALAMMGRQ